MLENISVDHQLFNELGIDSEELTKVFDKMGNKERSLSSPLKSNNLPSSSTFNFASPIKLYYPSSRIPPQSLIKIHSTE